MEDPTQRVLKGSGFNHIGQLGILPSLYSRIEGVRTFFDLDVYGASDDEVIEQIASGIQHSLILTNKRLFFVGNIRFNQMGEGIHNEKINTDFYNGEFSIDKLRELSGGEKIVRIENAYNNNAVIFDNGACITFGGRYVDLEHREMELLCKPDGMLSFIYLVEEYSVF